MRVKTLCGLLIALIAAPVFGEVPQRSREIVMKYDVDSATMTYCKVDGPFSGKGKVSTTGSSTTVVGSSSESFSTLAAGDVLRVQTGTSARDITVVAVTAVASATSLTIVTAQNWSAGYAWSYWDQTCGTAATDGWVDLSGLSDRTIVVSYEAGTTGGGGIDVVWECKGASVLSEEVQVYPDNWPSDVGTALEVNFADAAVGTKQARRAVRVPEPWSQCRVGLALQATDDAADAVLEEVNVEVMGLAQ
jgi:hypothetical protein